MSATDPTQHPNSQREQENQSKNEWEPKPLKCRLNLYSKTENPHNRFFSLIKEGFAIPKPCFFRTEESNEDFVRILIKANVKESAASNDTTVKEKSLSFRVTSSLSTSSTVCSELNMAIALSCTISAQYDNGKVIFTIIAPDEEKQNSLSEFYENCKGSNDKRFSDSK